MAPAAVIQTTVLMGLLVLCGGAWSALYCLGETRHRSSLKRAARACYLLALALAIAIALFTPLYPGWKLLVVASALAYAAIPPLTLRYLRGLHDEPEAHP